MTLLDYSPITGLSYRSAGRAAITSGILGVLAFLVLILALITRSSGGASALLFKTHDIGVILQFGLLIPPAFALCKLVQQRPSAISQARLMAGVGALSLVILLLVLSLLGLVADTLYMVPQGMFGLWLLMRCWPRDGFLTTGLRWSGVIVGFGLLLTGSFPIGYGLFVDPILFAVPAVDLGESPSPTTLSDTLVHLPLTIGTVLGVLPLPIWTMLLGNRLLGKSLS